MSTNDPTGAHGPGHDDHVPPSSGGRPDGPPDPGRTPGPGWTSDAGWTPGWQTEPPAQSAPGGAGGYAGGAGGWQTPPSGQAADGAQVPPWSPTAPPPAPSGHGFFESLRHSGWYRGDQRVLGGVCSGIAARTGWDVGLIRAVTVVLGLFLGPVWVAYGAAWALLPEQADGRIHLEQLTRGRYDVAQLGALVMVLLGLGNLFPWFLPDGSGWFLWSLALVAAITVVVIIANTGSRNRGYPPSAPWQGTPGAYGSGVPGTGSSSWQTPPAWQPGPAQQGSARPGAAQAGPAQAAPSAAQTGPAGTSTGTSTGTQRRQDPAQAAPVPPAGSTTQPRSSGTPGHHGAAWQDAAPAASVPRGDAWAAGSGPSATSSPQGAPGAPGRTWTPPPPSPAPRRLGVGTNLAVLGVIILLVAASLFFTFVGTVSELTEFGAIAIGCGTGLIVVGVVMAVAAIRDRGAGWMIALSLVGVLIALPLMAIVPWGRATQATQVPEAPQIASSAEYDWNASTISGIGDVDLDLRDAPVTTDKTITVEGSMGNLVVHVRQGQSVAFHIDGSTGSLRGEYYEDPDGTSSTDPWVPEVGYIADSLSFRSDGWDPGAGITVAISGSLGDITIVEDAPSSVAPSEGDAESGSAQSGADTTPAPTTSTPSPSGSATGDSTD